MLSGSPLRIDTVHAQLHLVGQAMQFGWAQGASCALIVSSADRCTRENHSAHSQNQQDQGQQGNLQFRIVGELSDGAVGLQP